MSSISVQPLPGYILVEAAEEITQTDSGVLLPDSAKEKVKKGTVIACGDSYDSKDQLIACPVKVGDIIFHKDYSGHEITHQGKEYKLIAFNDLLAREDTNA